MKKILYVLGFLVALAIGAIVLLPMFIPMDVVAAKVKEQVKQATGRDLAFSGAKIVFWPNIGVELKDVTLSNASWARDKNMLTLDRASVALAVQPLLQKRIEIKYFTLDAPVINLEVGADGKQSWVFTPEGAPAAAAPAGKSESAGGGMPAGYQFKFGKLEIKNGKLSYADRQKGSVAAISDLDVAATFPDLDSPLHLDGALTYKEKRVQLTLDVQKPMDFMNNKASPGQLSVKTPDLTFKSGGALAMQGDMFNGKVEADISSLAGLLAWVGDGKEQKLPFEKVSFISDVKASKSALALKDADLKLDEVNAKGNVNLGLEGKPNIYGRLSLNKLNLDRFTGGTTSGTAPAGGKAAPSSQGWDTTPIDVSGLKAVNADLALKTEGFSVKGVDVGPSTLTVLLKDGNLNFKSSEATLFGGKFSSNLTVNAAPATPTMGFSFKMDGVQAKPVLVKFASFDKLTGTAEASISVTSVGNNQKALVSALAGSGSVMFRNGTIEGIDLVNIAKLVQQHVASMNAGSGATEFVEMGGTFTIANGITTNNDLHLKGPLVQATGKGTVDLPQKYVQYRVIPTLLGGGAADKPSGISIPVDIRGPFSAIKIVPDFAGAVKDILNNPDAAKQTLKNVKDQGKAIEQNFKDIRKNLKTDPSKALQGLFGQGGLLGQPAPAPAPAEPTPAPQPQPATP